MTSQRFGMLVRRSSAAIAVVTLALGIAAAQAAESYRVRLTTVPIESRTSAEIKGSGSATATLDGTRLTIEGSFSGLVSDATGGTLHEGPVMAVRGPKIAEFTVPQAQSGSFSASLTLTPQQARSVAEGRVYIQIQSVGAPDGNLWGWLLK